MGKMIKFIPNCITTTRIIMSFIFAYLAVDLFAYGKGELISLIIVFIAICFSDLLDGKIARRMGCISTLGAKLDVFADLLYIILSYTTLIILKILPIWFLGFVCFKFIEFVITSNFINNHIKSLKNPFVFDKIGRIVSAMFFIIPGITCIYKYLMPYNNGYSNNFLLYTIFVAGIYSSFLRIKFCLYIGRSKNVMELENLRQENLLHNFDTKTVA